VFLIAPLSTHLNDNLMRQFDLNGQNALMSTVMDNNKKQNKKKKNRNKHKKYVLKQQNKTAQNVLLTSIFLKKNPVKMPGPLRLAVTTSRSRSWHTRNDRRTCFSVQAAVK